MARLPIPQGDDDVWGVILNDFLGVSLNTDGTLKTHTHDSTDITSGAWTVDQGGTGLTTTSTAYGVIAAGTTATGAFQTIAPGTAGQVLKSNGTSVLGSFATLTAADVGAAATSHAHTIADVTNLQTSLDGKAATAHAHTASDITSGVLNEAQVPTSILAPTGSINMWAVATPPSGWLLCEGQTVSRTTYATLFGILGTTYGAGDGSTTFTLPNMKGRVATGFDSGDASFSTTGQTGGAKTHTLTESEMPSHTHVQNSHNHTQNAHNHTQDAHNHTQNSHNHTQNAHGHTNWRATGYAVGGSSYGLWPSNTGDPVLDGTVTAIATNIATTATNIATTATNQAATAVNIAATATNQTTGGGAAHNNLQPYIVMRYIIKT